MIIKSSDTVNLKFDSYPINVKDKLQTLRNLVLEAAEELDDIEEIEETLKWGEPSFLTKKGSTVRMDWKAKNPGQYAIYFKCTSKLVTTFKEVFGDTFTYEKTRAILFDLENDIIPKKELKLCIKAALRYHKVKSQPLLGMIRKGSI